MNIMIWPVFPVSSAPITTILTCFACDAAIISIFPVVAALVPDSIYAHLRKILRESFKKLELVQKPYESKL